MMFNWLIALSLLLIASGSTLLIIKYIDKRREEMRRVRRSLPKNAIKALTSTSGEVLNGVEDSIYTRKAHK